MLKGFQYFCWAMVAHLALVLNGEVAAASGTYTVLLLSSDNAYYQETVQGLKAQTSNPRQFTTIILDSRGLTDSPLLDSSAQIITFGSRAATLVVERNLAHKSIFSYLTLEQYQGFQQAELQAVALLDQPLSRYLAFASALVDGAVTGTLLLDDASAGSNELENLKLELETAKLAAPTRLLSGLRDMLDRIDVFLMTPNRSLYNRNSLRGILLTSYRAGKPVISYSPAHVKSGALGSIYSSPLNIATHLLELLEAAPQPSEANRTIVEYARYYTIATNSRVAASLGIDIAEEETIRQRIEELSP